MSQRTVGYTVTKDNMMLIHPDIEGTVDSGVKVPQIDTVYGAGFGDSINDNDRAFAACREPIAHFLTYGVANDITEKWFAINDPDTEEADPALDRTIQDVLTELKFKKNLTDAITQARIYKKSLLVCAFNDAKDVGSLSKPLSKGAELMQFAVYPSTMDSQQTKPWTVEQKDENENSPRFGLPIIYKLDRGSGKFLFVHYTRILEVDNEQSVLDAVWDDVGCGRNIRWGAAQWLYRTGSGFPVIGFPSSTTKEQLQAFHESGLFNNLMSRTGIFIAQNSVVENTGMTFEFKGPAGQSLDPQPFFQSNVEQIAIATGIPQAKLIGAQAGAVTGSDVNMQDYYKVVSREQNKYEDVIRQVLTWLSESGQIGMIKTQTDKPDTYHVSLLKRLLKRAIKRDYRHKTVGKYVIEWNSAFELSEKDTAAIEVEHTQACSNKLKYMTKDEVRAEEGLDPLPNDEGASIVPEGLQLFGQQGNEKNPDGSPKNPEQAKMNSADKFLLIDLSEKKVSHEHPKGEK
jgi:hypothetical protein